MAKYKFGFSGFNVGDFLEVLKIWNVPLHQALRGRESWLFGQLDVFVGEPEPEDQKSANMMMLLLDFAARFTDGYALDGVPISDLDVFVQDFADALETALVEIQGNSQTPSPTEQ